LVSPCWASHFFLRGQEKVTKKKATPASGLSVPGLLHKTPSLRRRSGGRTRRPLTKGHPCPITPRSASVPRVPLRNAYARPPEGDSGPSRLDVLEQRLQQSTIFGRLRRVENCKAFSTAIDVATGLERCTQNRWVSFALPTLQKASANASLHGPTGTTESPLSGGRAQVAWKGLSGMDAARAAMGQGWPFAAGPWSVTGAREPRRSRGRMQGQAFLVTFFGAGHPAFGKSDSPSRAKPVLQPTRGTGPLLTQSPKASRASSLLRKTMI